LPAFNGSFLDLLNPGGDAFPIGIDKYYQSLPDSVLSISVKAKFLSESLLNELLTRAATLGTDFNALHSIIPAGPFKESARESFVLPIFTQENDLNVSAHFSHPLAITSDSFSPPSMAISPKGWTIVTPELSRFSTNPLSHPR
jgi:hypothetical protein